MVSLLALLPTAALAFTAAPLSLPRRAHVQPAAISLALPPDVAASNPWEKGTYDEKEVEELWETLREVYENDSKASAAAIQVRGTILCPLYSTPNRIRESKAALVDVLGEAEAAVVMSKNPAVLTCGDEIRYADPAEIMRLANLREVLDKIPPSVLLGVTLGISGFIAIKIALVQYDNYQMTSGGFPMS